MLSERVEHTQSFTFERETRRNDTVTVYLKVLQLAERARKGSKENREDRR